VSTELLRAGAAGGVNRLLQTELTNGVAAATDAEFISVLTSGISAIPSSGFTSLAVRADLRGLLASVNADKNSKLYLLMQATAAEQLSVLADSAGSAAFSQLTPTGGTIGGMTVVTTDAVAAGTIVLVDAAQIAAGQQTITLDASQEALLQINDVPDSPPIVSSLFTSLWQQDLSALRATRYFGVLRLRSTAVATLSGVSYTGEQSVMTMAPSVPAECVVQIAAISDRLIALSSEGKIWIANRATFDWRAVSLPPMDVPEPVQDVT
jgi:hypothetical protein